MTSPSLWYVLYAEASGPHPGRIVHLFGVKEETLVPYPNHTIAGCRYEHHRPDSPVDRMAVNVRALIPHYLA